MVTRPWQKQLIWLVVAIALLAGAGLVQPRLDQLREEHELVAPGNEVAEKYPLHTVLTNALGGLRTPVVTYLWIRSENLKQAGRHFDALQTAQMICRMMPRFPGVWDYHSWNLAYNISVETHTPEERWKWVYNGLKLVRDEGIPLNPKAIVLYKQLGWILMHKMGGTTDEMHMVYKRRLAARMQHLLSAPPESTNSVLQFFQFVADAPLDTSIEPTGEDGEALQREIFEKFLEEHDGVDRYVKALCKLLASAEDVKRGLRPDQIIGRRLLPAYNRFSFDAAASVVRPGPIQGERDDRPLVELINNPSARMARLHLLSLVRAHTLWNHYRMEAKWMYKLMQWFGPLDWRLPWSHSIYWTTIGMKRALGQDISTIAGQDESGLDMSAEDVKAFTNEIDPLNTYRNWLNCMRQLTFYGRMTYIENPQDSTMPKLYFAADTRFIEPGQRVHDRIARAVIRTSGKPYEENILKDGHINYLAACIGFYYAHRKEQDARKLFEWTKTNYHPKHKEWRMPLEDFVRIRLNKDGTPIPEYTHAQITAALQTGYYHLAMGNYDKYNESYRYAKLVYDRFMKEAPKRIRLIPFGVYQANIAAQFLEEPRRAGYNLPLRRRSALWARLPNGLKLMIYTRVSPVLKDTCKRFGISYASAFPNPVGLEEYLKRQARPIAPDENNP